MAVYETILSRLKKRNTGGYGRATLFSNERPSGSSVGLGVQIDTGPSPIQMQKGGKVLGYTERWRKARGG